VSLFSWLPRLHRGISTRRAGSGHDRRAASSAHRPRLTLEQLEYRMLPSNFTAATVSDLIADINAANATGGTNTITLAAKQTFTITQLENVIDGANGLPVIVLGDNLTIVGNGDTIQRDNKSAAFRLFEVAAGASLTLVDLTLQNGLASGFGRAGLGGGVLTDGNLTVSGCTLSSNSASYAGGGIWSSSTGFLTVSGCTLSHNAAGYSGGGIYNFYGAATVQSSTLSHNSAEYGGAIYGVGSLTLCSDTVESNTPGVAGGGIYIAFGATVYIDSFTVANTIHNTDGSGPKGSTANIDNQGTLIQKNR
jgi:parallel beta-helix repeat protein/predicted outer membrane repeat protein